MLTKYVSDKLWVSVDQHKQYFKSQERREKRREERREKKRRSRSRNPESRNKDVPADDLEALIKGTGFHSINILIIRPLYFLTLFQPLIVLEIVQPKPVSEEQRRIEMYLRSGKEIEELKAMNVLQHKFSLQVYSSLLHRLFINPSRTTS